MFQAKSLKEILQPKTLFDKTYIRFQAYFIFAILFMLLSVKFQK